MASLSFLALTNVSYSTPYNPFSLEVDRVLLESDHTSQILRTLYCLFKGRQKKVSLTFICRSAGIPSKGYLALVMNGQRRLHEKYWESIFRTFKLNDRQRDILQAFLELDQLTCQESQSLQWHQIRRLQDRLRAEPAVNYQAKPLF